MVQIRHRWVAVLFGVLGILLYVVIFMLPGWAEQRETPESTVQDVVSVPAATDQEQDDFQPPAQQAPAIAPDSTIAADEVVAEPEGEPDVAPDHFARAMSDGLAALDDKEYEAAAEAFRRAGELQPESAQVADALLRVEQARNLELILVHGERSRGFEEQERWVEALAEYDSVLTIDGTVRFAQEGSRRAAARADLARRIDYHIEHPDRLVSHAVHDEAELLLADATEVGKSGPRLERQITDLRRLLDGAATRVKVYLESDLKTEVTVYKIGRLGRFERHELELRAGTYTVVGTRQGYRDVRRQLVVEVDGQPARLTVSCTEKI